MPSSLIAAIASVVIAVSSGAATSADRTANGQLLGDPDAPVAGSVLGHKVRARDAEELRYIVLGALTDRCAAAHRIEVTNEEKHAHVARVRAPLRQEHRQAVTALVAWERKLPAPGLSPAQRAGLVAKRDAYCQFLETAQERGDISIGAETMRHKFWQYFLDDQRHSFYERGSSAEVHAFDVPP